ncbi:MAG TPA: peptidase E [Steroidobacteraceae bacterium]|jgi:dipeptidase E|nr:peptidase E [Steroidobacteraceae bacterium]
MKRILALGGGGFLMENRHSPVDQYIVRLTAKVRPRICFVATASGDLPENIDRFYEAYGSLECEPCHLAFFRKPLPGALALSSLEDSLLGMDAIFVGGGNTKSALGVWQEWGLRSILQRALAAGVLLAGVSAGAICWFEGGITDSFWGAGFQPIRALGFLSGACSVHYHSEALRQERLHEHVEARMFHEAIGIDDYAGVLYEDGRIAKVLSWRRGATAYRVGYRDGRVVEEALGSENIRAKRI